MKKIALLVVVSCILSGCSSLSSTYSSVTSYFSGGSSSGSSTVDMTYDCSPAGATIVEQGETRLGTCPVTVQYHPNDAQRQEGKFYTRKLTAVWPDGAASSVPSLTVDISSNHKASYTFVHTDNAPVMAGPESGGMAPAPAPYPNTPPTSGNLMAVSVGELHMHNSTSMTDIPPPPAGEALAAHQDRDFFDNFNKKANCEINNYIDSKTSGCSPKDGFQ